MSSRERGRYVSVDTGRDRRAQMPEGNLTLLKGLLAVGLVAGIITLGILYAQKSTTNTTVVVVAPSSSSSTGASSSSTGSSESSTGIVGLLGTFDVLMMSVGGNDTNGDGLPDGNGGPSRRLLAVREGAADPARLWNLEYAILQLSLCQTLTDTPLDQTDCITVYQNIDVTLDETLAWNYTHALAHKTALYTDMLNLQAVQSKFAASVQAHPGLYGTYQYGVVTYAPWAFVRAEVPLSGTGTPRLFTKQTNTTYTFPERQARIADLTAASAPQLMGVHLKYHPRDVNDTALTSQGVGFSTFTLQRQIVISADTIPDPGLPSTLNVLFAFEPDYAVYGRNITTDTTVPQVLDNRGRSLDLADFELTAIAFGVNSSVQLDRYLIDRQSLNTDRVFRVLMDVYWIGPPPSAEDVEVTPVVHSVRLRSFATTQSTGEPPIMRKVDHVTADLTATYFNFYASVDNSIPLVQNFTFLSSVGDALSGVMLFSVPTPVNAQDDDYAFYQLLDRRFLAGAD